MHVFNLFSRKTSSLADSTFGEVTKPRSNAHRSVARAGFTLIELIAVVIIIGIAASIVLSQSTTANWFTMHGTIIAIMRDLEYVQAEAMRDQRKLNVRFEANDDAYFVYGSSNSAGSSIESPVTQTVMYPVSLAETMGDTQTQIEGSTFSNAGPSASSALTFLETGEPVQYVAPGSSDYHNSSLRSPIHQNNRIVLRNGQQTLQLHLAPVTGLMTVE